MDDKPEYLAAYYVLNNDLASNTAYYDDYGKDWDPIGDNNNYFPAPYLENNEQVPHPGI